ncbi:MAG: MYG1 family protein [Candidatus Nomurabacteria bacterium]|nr:MYG1 family protein [Candidatus Nomurabacteria bacterium]
MSFLNKNKICVTHDGTFHADDLFATAALSILNNGNIKIIRTRDRKLIDKGDYIYDVGGESDGSRNLFDHHQKGGAGERANGIPYASFGLVWKQYGEQICGSKEIADRIDQKIAQPIDAIDNGIDISKPIFEGVSPYFADQVFLNYIPTWKESNKNIDKIFKEQVERVVVLLKREIEVVGADIEAANIIMQSYKNSTDKRIVIINNDFPRYLYQYTLSKLPEPLYIVLPSGHSTMWKVEAIRVSPGTMENRKLFPESWRGYFNGDSKLKKNTGVVDADFCHKSGFLITALSKEGAIKLAEKAIIA